MTDGSRANKYSEQYKLEVEKQKIADREKREAILKKFNAFKKKFQDKVPNEKVSFELPLAAETITEIGDLGSSDHNGRSFHYNGIILPRVYGYVNASTLNMRSEDNSKSEVIGKLTFRDKVEILYKSEKIDEIENMKSPWFLIRKENGDEGWIFGAYVSDTIPAEKETDKGKTDWGGMIVPTSGWISSKFGYRVDPITKKLNSFHSGLDIAAPEGTPVYAAEGGKITEAAFKDNGYGNLIIIQHSPDLVTYYAHLSKIDTSKGKEVKKGDYIAKVGKTGRVTGPHLHFEVRKGGQALDPETFIR